MNREFIYNIPEKVLYDQNLTLADIRIYAIVRSFMDTTGEAYPSNNWIATKLNIERRSVIRCISKLLEKGYLVKSESNGRRYLMINISKIDVQLVTQMPPPSDLNVTPPSDLNVTQLDQNNITPKDINSFVRCSDESVSEVKNSPEKKVVTPDNYRTHPKFELYQKFYSQYPKREQPYAGFRAFMKLKPSEELLEKIILDAQKRFARNEDKQFIPLPASYLNGRHWEGEVIAPSTTSQSYRSPQERAKNELSTQAREDIAAKQKRAEMARLREMRELVNNKPSEEQRSYGIQSLRAIKDILATG